MEMYRNIVAWKILFRRTNAFFLFVCLPKIPVQLQCAGVSIEWFEGHKL